MMGESVINADLSFFEINLRGCVPGVGHEKAGKYTVLVPVCPADVVKPALIGLIGQTYQHESPFSVRRAITEHLRGNWGPKCRSCPTGPLCIRRWCFPTVCRRSPAHDGPPRAESLRRVPRLPTQVRPTRGPHRKVKVGDYR